MNEHLILAGKFSRDAHNNWLVAMRESTPDDEKADAMRKGDAAMESAEQHLRKHGVDMDCITNEEREMLLADECFNSVGETPLDFKPLRHAVIVSEAIIIFNTVAFAALMLGFGFVFGYGVGQEVGTTTYPTAADMQQMEQRLSQPQGE